MTHFTFYNGLENCKLGSFEMVHLKDGLVFPINFKDDSVEDFIDKVFVPNGEYTILGKTVKCNSEDSYTFRNVTFSAPIQDVS